MRFIFLSFLLFVSCFKLRQEITIKESLSAQINLSYSLDKKLFNLLQQINSPIVKYFSIENIRLILTRYPTKIHAINFFEKENTVEINLDVDLLDYSWFTKKEVFFNQKLYQRYGRYFYDLYFPKMDTKKYEDFWETVELELIINIPRKIYKTNFQRVDKDTVRLYLNNENMEQSAEKYFLEFE